MSFLTKLFAPKKATTLPPDPAYQRLTQELDATVLEYESHIEQVKQLKEEYRCENTATELLGIMFDMHNEYLKGNQLYGPYFIFKAAQYALQYEGVLELMRMWTKETDENEKLLDIQAIWDSINDIELASEAIEVQK